MNLTDKHYASYALVQEMMQTIEVIRNFNPLLTQELAGTLSGVGRLFLTGEGSSRIFPAKNVIRKSLTQGLPLTIATECSRQSALYDLSSFAVFLASNSGRTKEVVQLAGNLAKAGNLHRYGLSANEGTLLEKECVRTFVLRCGWEQAVAATKSVVEQALFYESILWNLRGVDRSRDCLSLADGVAKALTMPIPAEIVAQAVAAPTIYFSGYNDGVAEELTLKTNEITRKKSDFLEGTYAVHGIEEVMDPNDIVFVVDPIDEEIEKFQQVLEQGVGLSVVAIAAKETPFPTLLVPDAGDLNPYVFLAAGWNLLVEIGLASGIDLDKPVRARKVGNEMSVSG